jgi:hypothetical protein
MIVHISSHHKPQGDDTPNHGTSFGATDAGHDVGGSLPPLGGPTSPRALDLRRATKQETADAIVARGAHLPEPDRDSSTWSSVRGSR